MKKYEHGMDRDEDSPIEDIAIYLGMPMAFGREECMLHGKGVLESTKQNIMELGESSLTIAQNLEGIKFMELPRIDYRIMCADLGTETFNISIHGFEKPSLVGSWLQEFRHVSLGCHGETEDSQSHHYKNDRTRWLSEQFAT
jgi:hypothetical protein